MGNPAHIPAFKGRVAAAGLDKRVFFLGAMKDVTAAYQAADCLAHPTLEDTFAMVVLEAMAHALPVVVSPEPYCGIAALLTDGENALILRDPQNANTLADSLKRVLHDDALRARLGIGAVAFALQYQWPQIALRQEAIYATSAAASR